LDINVLIIGHNQIEVLQEQEGEGHLRRMKVKQFAADYEKNPSVHWLVHPLLNK